MTRIILAACLVVLSAVALAEEPEFLRGQALKDIAVGNTFYVFHPGCTETDANFIVYFAEDGKAYAKDRPCMTAPDRARSLKGRWTMSDGEFCVRELGEVQEHCYEMVKVGENTYKRIDRTGLRTDWSMAVLKPGNPEKF
ncbi:MAG: hypothetical protein ACWGPN_03480 [Gammaproteobacteria bacterium]|jgi:hypothetical protein